MSLTHQTWEEEQQYGEGKCNKSIVEEEWQGVNKWNTAPAEQELQTSQYHSEI